MDTTSIIIICTALGVAGLAVAFLLTVPIPRRCVDAYSNLLECYATAVITIFVSPVRLIYSAYKFATSDRIGSPNGRWQRTLRRRRQRTSEKLEQRVQRQVWGARRRMLALQDLSEKRPLAAALRIIDGPGRGRRMPDLENGDLAYPIPVPDQKVHIQDLSAELRVMIYAHLDYRSALALNSVCRLFRNDRPEQAIDREQQAVYVYDAETFTHNSSRLACFGCLRLKHVVHFSSRHRTESFARYGSRELERRCLGCEAESERPWWTKGWLQALRVMDRSKGLLARIRS